MMGRKKKEIQRLQDLAKGYENQLYEKKKLAQAHKKQVVNKYGQKVNVSPNYGSYGGSTTGASWNNNYYTTSATTTSSQWYTLSPQTMTYQQQSPQDPYDLIKIEDIFIHHPYDRDVVQVQANYVIDAYTIAKHNVDLRTFENALKAQVGQSINQAMKQSRKLPTGFNRYLNGSDLLEEFIKFLGEEKVRQGEALQLPIELFIKWLVVRACEQDGEEAPITVEIPHHKQPRCIQCKRFMRASPVQLHERCAPRYFHAVEKGNGEMLALPQVEESSDPVPV